MTSTLGVRGTRTAARNLLTQLLRLAAYLLLFKFCRYAKVNALIEVPLDLERVELIKRRFLTLASCMPMDKFLSGWFRGASPDKVLKGNVADFIAYGFYCRTLEQLTPEVRCLPVPARHSFSCKRFCHSMGYLTALAKCGVSLTFAGRI